MMWIVGALYGGYVMANVLKWYWWRFNGYGYFWGMMTGIISAMIVPFALQSYVDHRSESFTAADLANVPGPGRKTAIPFPGRRFPLRERAVDTRHPGVARPKPGRFQTNLGQALAGDLNRIINAGSIYDTNRFAGVTLSARTKDFIKKEKPSASDVVLLNRMLLENAFPSEIASRLRFSVNALYSFPFILALSIAGCILGTLLRSPRTTKS